MHRQHRVMIKCRIVEDWIHEGSRRSKACMGGGASRSRSHSQACLNIQSTGHNGTHGHDQPQKSQASLREARMTDAIWRANLAYRTQC